MLAQLFQTRQNPLHPRIDIKQDQPKPGSHLSLSTTTNQNIQDAGESLKEQAGEQFLKMMVEMSPQAVL